MEEAKKLMEIVMKETKFKRDQKINQEEDYGVSALEINVCIKELINLYDLNCNFFIDFLFNLNR